MSARQSQQVVEVLGIGSPKARTSQQAVEVLAGGSPKSRSSQIVVEILCGVTVPLEGVADHTIAFSDFADFDVLTPIYLDVESTVPFAQAAGQSAIKDAENDLALSQILYVAPLRGYRVFSNPIWIQDVLVNTILNLDVESTIAFEQVLKRVIEQDIEQTITFTQVLVGVASKNIVHSITFTHDVEVIHTYGRSVLHFFGLHDTVGLKRNINIGPIQHLLQVRHGGRIFPIKNRSIVHNVVLSDELVKSRTASSQNTLLALAHDADVTKVINKSVTQNITFNQTLVRTATFKHDLVHTLHFREYRIEDIRIGNLDSVIIPSIIVTKIPHVQTLPTGQISRKNQIMTLSVADRAITLPAPIFGDSVGNTDVFNMSLSITGKIYTTVKTSLTKALTYEWDLPYNKGEELAEFVWDNNVEAIQIQTWHGQLWVARILSNPVSFRDQMDSFVACSGKISVALEFEGLRIH